MLNSRAKGYFAESVAILYLQKLGYVICQRNFYVRGGEIDIIAKKNLQLVFCEVKRIKNSQSEFHLVKINYKKQQALILAAQHYISLFDTHDLNCRFDVIWVSNNLVVDHYKNAFRLMS